MTVCDDDQSADEVEARPFSPSELADGSVVERIDRGLVHLTNELTDPRVLTIA